MWGRLILVSVFGLLTVLPAGAQYKMRVVTGIVTDTKGNALPKAAVQLENTRTLSVRSYITGKDGRFSFNELNDDIDFLVRAKYNNWSSKPKTISKFDSSTHPEVVLVIPID
jgi:Carboxypeptidase regulatory-like domain